MSIKLYQGSTYSLSPYRIPKCNDLIVLRLKLDIHIGTYNINNKVLNVRPTPYHLRLCILLFWKGLVRCKANNWIRNFLLRITQMLWCSSIISEQFFTNFFLNSLEFSLLWKTKSRYYMLFMKSSSFIHI